ncbi:hypothetical protein KAS79_01030 [Candidatus Parcubacteria bacterium]|nr:hypothetical protein [Candidatus Parcubacteria bacterium]
MHGDYIYLDDKTIRLYIKKYGKRLMGKDYELGAAIILKGFFEIENGFDCVVGIKLNPKYLKYYEKNSKPLTVDEAKDLIEIHNEENDLVDVAISPVGSFYGKKNVAWIFQLKRFGHFQKEKDTKGLIHLLSKIQKKYTKSSAILVIFFDGHKGINLEKTARSIYITGFPFSKIMFINTNKNKDGVWKIHIGEIWPNYGYNEYNPRKLVKKMFLL